MSEDPRRPFAPLRQLVDASPHPSPVRGPCRAVSGRLEQTMRAVEVSIGGLEEWESESRPILCGRRRTLLETPLMDRPGDSARKPSRIASMVLRHDVTSDGRHRGPTAQGRRRGRPLQTSDQRRQSINGRHGGRPLRVSNLGFVRHKKEGAGKPPRERNGKSRDVQLPGGGPPGSCSSSSLIFACSSSSARILAASASTSTLYSAVCWFSSTRATAAESPAF